MMDDEKLFRLNHQLSDLPASEEPIIIHSLPQKKVSGSGSGQAKITKISAQKTPGRYNIFINDRFAFGISEDLLVEFELHKGMEISQSLKDRLLDQEKIQKAYHEALNYLGYRQRSEKEVSDYLIEKGYDTEIESVIQKLHDLRLLDDQLFADMYVRTAVAGGKKGSQKIERELLQKGIDDEKIMRSLHENYTEEMQTDNALKLAEKKWSAIRHQSEREAQQKLSQYLKQRGFDQPIIQRALQILDPEMDQEQEYEHLKNVADKAWRRYSRQADGYEREQKVRAYLYRKQYPQDLIEKYMAEKKLTEDES